MNRKQNAEHRANHCANTAMYERLLLHAIQRGNFLILEFRPNANFAKSENRRRRNRAQ